MTTNESDKSPLSLGTSTAKSLFSKLTLPSLRQRTRNLTEFHIKPKEPHRRYSPGDLVEGVVVLKVVKPIRVTHITVALHGFVHVFKSANNTQELTNNESQYLQSGNAKKSQYFGNGHASLFQDEVTLCGEGRIEPGVYEFAFELEFPRRALPSSIDFERGTISYQIRATITRPTSIAAVTSCDRKINLVESVDVGLLTMPKPQTISLEPILKRGRKSKAVKHMTAEPEEGVISDELGRSDSPIAEESASQVGSVDRPIVPRSPIHSDGQSERSADSVVSSSTGTSFRLAPVPVFKPGRASRQSTLTASEKTITAKVELLKGGCLPGDNLPLKITIQHTKVFRSMHGIIITLYRQCRIDSAPPLELFKDLTGKAADKMKHEEYYPKSKTGLGGLSLSSAGSSSTFRKDLSQSFAPIIIDPTTLATEVPATIRVPEDVFPTITGTPAQMIVFKYFIEVVVDLGGKLAGQERHVARMGMINVPTNFVERPGRNEGSGNTLSALGGNIVETEHVRREKSVVTCNFEIVVGTKDSLRYSRRRGDTLSRRYTNDGTSLRSQAFTHAQDHYGDEDEETPHALDSSQTLSVYPNGSHYPNDDYHPNGSHHHENNQERNNNARHHPNGNNTPPMEPESYGIPSIHVPAPEVPGEDNLTEKERIRRAEQRLLPSQPPEDEASSSSQQRLHVPTAPAYVDDHDGIPNYIQATTPGPSTPFAGQPNPFEGPSAPPAMDVLAHHLSHADLHTHEPEASSSAAAAVAAHVASMDDKQELERRRLMNEASSPNDFLDADEEADGHTTPHALAAPTAPSAPTLDDEYGYECFSTGNDQNAYVSIAGPSSSVNRRASEHLPKYER